MYQGLPGLILEVNDGELTIICSKIVLNPEDKVRNQRTYKRKRSQPKRIMMTSGKKVERNDGALCTEKRSERRKHRNTNRRVETLRITLRCSN